MAKDTKIKPCYLFSKCNYSVRVPYGDDYVTLPPFANKFRVSNETMVGNLPNGVQKIAIMEVR